MCIRTAHAERTHARQLSSLRPIRNVRQYLNGHAVPRDVRVRSFKIELPRQTILLHRQQNFNQPRHPGGCFQVPDISLHRADQQRILFGTITSQRCGGCLQLDWIAKLRPRTVSFQIRDVFWLNVRSFQRLPNHLFLRLRIGHRQAAAGTVVPDC